MCAYGVGWLLCINVVVIVVVVVVVFGMSPLLPLLPFLPFSPLVFHLPGVPLRPVKSLLQSLDLSDALLDHIAPPLLLLPGLPDVSLPAPLVLLNPGPQFVHVALPLHSHILILLQWAKGDRGLGRFAPGG